MKTLILFSLKRRFFNPVALTLQGLFTVGLILLFNVDHISAFLHLEWTQPIKIQVSEKTRETLLVNELWEAQGLTLTQTNESLTIDYVDGVYEVKGSAPLPLQAKIYGLLLQSHQQRLLNESHPSVADFIMRYNTVEVRFENAIDPMASVRENLVFAILTSVYFMLLNFISVNSSEVIQEKTSNILEFVLTSITPLQHFGAKIVTGLANVLIQVMLSVGIFMALFIQRWNADQGQGLLSLANKVFNLEASGITPEAIKTLLIIQPDFWVKAGLALLFLLMGLLIIQVLILVLSARVKTIEEAASIQGPFYLGLLALYYGCMAINTPQQLSQGIGRLLSMLPVSSMLVMGMRLLNAAVSEFEIAFSLAISMVCLFLLIWIGSSWYQKGLVNE